VPAQLQSCAIAFKNPRRGLLTKLPVIRTVKRNNGAVSVKVLGQRSYRPHKSTGGVVTTYHALESDLIRTSLKICKSSSGTPGGLEHNRHKEALKTVLWQNKSSDPLRGNEALISSRIKSYARYKRKQREKPNAFCMNLEDYVCKGSLRRYRNYCYDVVKVVKLLFHHTRDLISNGRLARASRRKLGSLPTKLSRTLSLLFWLKPKRWMGVVMDSLGKSLAPIA